MVHIREMPIRQFWGLHLQPGETYIQKALFDFHVTMAALDWRSLQSQDDKPHSVYCLHSTSRYLLCTLSRGKVWQQQLDLYFTEGEELGFLVEGGDAEVHLTGHVIPDDSDEAPELVEMDTPADYFTGGKRKRETEIKNQVLANKAKKLRLEDMEDEDYDSDEDEDFEVDDDSDFEDDDFQAYLDDEAEEDDDDDDEDEEEDDEDEDEWDDMDESEEDEKKLPVTSKGKKNDLGKKGTPGQGSPVKAQPNKGTPGGKPTPGKPTPGKGTPGMPGKKDKKPQTPGLNKSAGKNAATPVPQTPKSVNTTQNSEGESSKKKRKRNRKKNKNKSNTNTPTVSDQTSSTTPSNTSQQQSSKAKQQQTPQGKQQQSPKAQPSTGAGRQVLAGGTVVQELRKGQGPVAKPGQKVAVYYRGCLASGKQFDSKTEGKPFKFRLGAGEVIKGWDVGLQGMKVGGKRKITVPPSQGYGNARQGPIPPNSSLVFEVELKSVS